MKICGILCEFNPFHNGHAYLIEQVKAKSGCDAIVCIMSGNFTQRGEAAVLEKHERAKHAVLAGADAVIELPAVFATAPAELFARGGIRLLTAVPEFDCLAFGCENSDSDNFRKTAELCLRESEELRAALRENLQKGCSLPRARCDALERCGHTDAADLLRSPNNILGAEYCKALLAEGSSARILPVLRNGAGHTDEILHDDLSSATAIRTALADGKADGLCGNMPAFVWQDLRRAPRTDAYRSVALCALLSHSPAQLKNILDCGEGLENRLLALAEQMPDYDRIVAAATGKRYIASRIRRILAAAVLGIDEALVRECFAQDLYLNLLAVRQASKDSILPALKKAKFPVLLRSRDETELSACAARCLLTDRRADHIYAAVTHTSARTKRSLFI